MGEDGDTAKASGVIRHVVLLLLLSASVLVPGLGQITMERQQELRVALCAGQMVESGDWVIPRFQGQVRLRKPPLMYWLVAGIYTLTGATDSPFWSRVPGVISGLLLTGLVYAMGWRMFSSMRAGLWAAITLVGSFGFIRHARLAETDVTLTLFTTLAIFLVYLALQHRRSWWLWPLAGVAVGLGFMTKGPAAVAMPLAALFIYAVGVEEGRKQFSPLGLLLLVLVAVAIAGPWYWTIHKFTQAMSGEAQQLGQELSDTFAETKHPGTMFFYVYTLPQMMLPVGLLLPFSVVAFFREKTRSIPRFFMASWFVSSFLILSLVASKQSHYAILLLPVSCLLIGRWLDHLDVHLPVGRLAWIASGLALLATVFVFVVYPRVDGLSATPTFLRAVKPATVDAPRVHVVGINSAVFEFYLGRRVDNLDHVGQAVARAESGDVIVAIKKQSRFAADELPQSGSVVRDEVHGKYRFLFYIK